MNGAAKLEADRQARLAAMMGNAVEMSEFLMLL